MQLREAEPFGALDDHDGGVRHVNPNLDDRCRHQDLGLAGDEFPHLRLLVGRLHTTMHHTDLIFGKDRLEGLETGLQVLVIKLLIPLDQGIDHINLPSFADLLPEELIELGLAGIVTMKRLDRLTARGQLIDYRDIEVAIKGHGQCPGNWGGGHYQNMGRHGVLHPKTRALLDTETVLLVDNGQAQRGEPHRLLDQGVRPDHDLYLTARDGRQDLVTLPFPGRARQQRYLYLHPFQELADCRVMLGRQDFGRCHQAGLASVIEGQKHHQKTDKRLAAADVALQEAIHLPPAAHIGPHLANHPLLRIGQLKRQMLIIKGIEIVAHPWEGDAPQFPLPVCSRPEHVQLDIEKLLELQPPTGRLEHPGIIGEMNVAHRLREGNQPRLRQHIGRQGLRQGPMDPAQQGILQVLDRPRVEERPFHLLRRIVERHQAARKLLRLIDTIQVRMRDVVLMIEGDRLAEHQIFRVDLIFAGHEIQSLEPDQVNDACSISKLTHQSPATAHADRLETSDPATQLDIRQVVRQVGYPIDAAPVHIFIRIVIEQVPIGNDAQLPLEDLRFLRTDSRQVNHRPFLQLKHKDPAFV